MSAFHIKDLYTFKLLHPKSSPILTDPPSSTSHPHKNIPTEPFCQNSPQMLPPECNRPGSETRDAKEGEWGMTSGQFHSGPGMARPKAGAPKRTADQKPAADTPARPAKEREGLKHANPQDKYILILLEYKLMPQLVYWTGPKGKEG